MISRSKFQWAFGAAFLAGALTIPVTEGPARSPAHAAKSCGGQGQRACTVFERPGQPCDKGLKQKAKSRLDLGTCHSTTQAPVYNGRPYRNPPPQARSRVRDNGLYSDHGGATSIKLCNRSKTLKIYAAIGYYDWGIYGDRPNWSSAGWWPLNRGQCKVVGLIDDYEAEAAYAGDVYVMAVGGGLAWEGEGGSFCVDRNRDFRIKNSDRQRCSDRNTLYGVELIVTPGVMNFFDFDG